ncbi:LamG-like jellyroll fold domain-containing protein [Sphingomonas adhaesiva]|uniref:LamG-like jellyroll fold domain-containing protein n=1 Tax=Sphingomonas adhaesiva TaxID=28212 RepID=UPI002FFA58B9
MKALAKGAALLLATAAWTPALAEVPVNGGPYNVSVLPGGIGAERTIGGAAGTTLAAEGAPYTLSAWVKPDARQAGVVPLIGVGPARELVLADGRLMLVDGAMRVAGPAIAPARWTHVAAVSDGSRVTLYVDGRRVASGAARAAATTPVVNIARATPGQPHFGGTLVGATVDAAALDARAVAQAARTRPDFANVQLWQVGAGWPFQKQANIGLTQQQDAWTLPQTKGDAYTAPVAKPVVAKPATEALAPGRWQINGWQLAAAPEVAGDGAALSRPGRAGGTWRAATVPGTVLQTLVDRGVYPDPYYGLNNLKIPESLARQDYWYRTTFTVPAAGRGQEADARLRRG